MCLAIGDEAHEVELEQQAEEGRGVLGGFHGSGECLLDKLVVVVEHLRQCAEQAGC